ncbi:aspartate carbamoyltransferase, regulatory subunit domain protein, partial [Ancylostoma duodenale]
MMIVTMVLTKKIAHKLRRSAITTTIAQIVAMKVHNALLMNAPKQINRCANRNALICRSAIAAIALKDSRLTRMITRVVTMLMNVT